MQRTQHLFPTPIEKKISLTTKFMTLLTLRDAYLGKAALKLQKYVGRLRTGERDRATTFAKISVLLTKASRKNKIDTSRKEGMETTLLTYFLSELALELISKPLEILEILKCFKNEGSANFFQADHKQIQPLEYALTLLQQLNYADISEVTLRSEVLSLFNLHHTDSIFIPGAEQSAVAEDKHMFSQTHMEYKTELSALPRKSKHVKFADDLVQTDESKTVELHLTDQEKNYLIAIFVKSLKFNTRDAIWMYFNEFYTALGFSIADSKLLFKAITENFDSEVTAQYFIILMSKLSNDSLHRATLIKIFFSEPNTPSNIFRCLALYGKKNQSWNHFTNELIEGDWFSPDDCLAKISEVLQIAFSDTGKGEKPDYMLMAIDTARFLMEKQLADPFYNKNGLSFFYTLLSYWDSSRLNLKIGDKLLIPHHLPEERYTRYFQIPILLNKNPLQDLAYVIIYNDLFPVANNSVEFGLRCKLHFSDDLSNDEIVALRESVKNLQLTELPNFFITALQHQLGCRGISSNLSFMELLKEFYKKTPQIYISKYDLETKHMITVNKNKNPIMNERLKLFSFNLQGKTVCNYLIHAQTLMSFKHTQQQLLTKGSLLRLELFYRELIESTLLADITIDTDNNPLDNLLVFDRLTLFLSELPLSSLQSLLTRIFAKESANIDLHHMSFGLAFLRALAKKDHNLLIYTRAFFQNIFQELNALLEWQQNPYLVLFLNNITTEFYESFFSLQARQHIINNANNPNFKNLYAIAKQVPTDFNLIRLMANARINPHLFAHEDCYLNLSKIQSSVQAGSQHEATIFKILKSFTIKNDFIEGDESYFRKTLFRVADMLTRLSPLSVDSVTKNCYLKILEVALQQTEIDMTENSLITLLNEIKINYPVEDDLVELLEKVLSQDSADLLGFVKRINANQLLDKLYTDDFVSSPAYKILKRIESLIFIENCNKNHVKLLKLLCVNHPARLPVNYLKDLWLTNCAEVTLLLLKNMNDVNVKINFINTFLNKLSRTPSELHSLVNEQLFLEIVKQASEYPAIKALFRDWLATPWLDIPSYLTQTGLQMLGLGLLKVSESNLTEKELNCIASTNVTYKNKFAYDLWQSREGLNPAYFKQFCEYFSLAKSQLNYFKKLLENPKILSVNNRIISHFASFTQGLSNLETLLDDDLSATIQHIALNSKDPFTETSALNYLSVFFSFIKKVKKENLQLMFSVITEGLINKAQYLNLNEIIILLTKFEALRIPATYPIIDKLNNLFHDPNMKNFNDWVYAINQIFSNIYAFNIAGLPVELIQDLFLKSNPNLNTMIKSRICSNPIEYFIKTYFGCRQFIMDYTDAKDKVSDKDLKICINYYKTLSPGKWDIETDIKFFGSLYVICKATLQKEPYHTQHVTLMGILYSQSDAKARSLFNVGSGQGKTLLMAIAAVILHKIKNCNFMPILTLTKNLAQANQKEMQPFFTALGITSSANIYDSKAIICYTDMENLTQYKDRSETKLIFAGKAMRLRKVLLIDESDVPIEDLKKKGILNRNYFASDLVKLLKDIWYQIQNGTNPADQSAEQFINRYLLTPTSREYMLIFFKDIVKQAQKIINEEPTSNIDKFGEKQFEKSTGIVYSRQNHHAKTFFRSLHNNISLTSFTLVSRELNYSDVIDDYENIMGLSGTLGSAEVIQEYKDLGFTVGLTPNFNASKLICDTPIIVDDDKFYSAVKAKAFSFTVNKQSVLIVFERPEQVKDFIKNGLRCEETSVNMLISSVPQEEYEKFLEEAGKPGAISVVSIIGARGIDTTITNSEVNHAGGMVVINTTIPDTDRLEDQAKFRTARLDHPGRYLPVYKLSEFERFLSSANIPLSAIRMNNARELISEARKVILQKNSSKNAKPAKLSEKLSKSFYEKIIESKLSTETKKSLYETFIPIFNKAYYRDNEAEIIQEYNAKIGKVPGMQFKN